MIWDGSAEMSHRNNTEKDCRTKERERETSRENSREREREREKDKDKEKEKESDEYSISYSASAAVISAESVSLFRFLLKSPEWKNITEEELMRPLVLMSQKLIESSVSIDYFCLFCFLCNFCVDLFVLLSPFYVTSNYFISLIFISSHSKFIYRLGE